MSVRFIIAVVNLLLFLGILASAISQGPHGNDEDFDVLRWDEPVMPHGRLSRTRRKYDCEGRPHLLLMQAAMTGNLTEVRRLVTKCGANVKKLSYRGSNALHEAAFYGHPEVVSFLIDEGADPNQPKTDGWGPLHLAILSPKPLEVMKVLLAKGADIHGRTNDKYKKQAIAIAQEVGKKDVEEYLLEAQKVGTIGNQGQTSAPLQNCGGLCCAEEAMKALPVTLITAAFRDPRPFDVWVELLGTVSSQCNLGLPAVG